MLPLVKMVVAPNFFEMVGGATTVNGAVAYPLELVFTPLCVEVIFPLMFWYCPAVVPVTVTLILQVPPAANVPPVNAIVLVAAVVVKLFVPPQAETVESATDKPAGNTSVNATPLKAEPEFGFVTVNVSVEFVFCGMEIGAKLLEILGGLGLELRHPLKTTLSRYILAVVF